MNNIIKAQFYQLRRSGFIIRVFLLFILALALVSCLEIMNDDGTASSLIVGSYSMAFIFPIMMMGLFVSVFVGEDFSDQTANYELLIGHSRFESFFARAVSAVIVTSVACGILSFIPLIVGKLIFPWGDAISLSNAIIRNMLYFFPFLRLAAFLTMLSFVVRNQYFPIIMGFVFDIMHGILSDSVSDNKNFLTSFYNFNLIGDCETIRTYNLDPVKGIVNYYAYDTAIDWKMIVGTIVVSLLVAAIYLIIGYAFYRREEIK